MFSRMALMIALWAALTLAAPSQSWSADDEASSPSRVISMAPNLTEAVFAIGGGDQIVGRTSYCKWPAEAMELPSCGGFVDPNLEAIVALQPDLILTQSDNEKLVSFAKVRQISVAKIHMNSFEEIRSGLTELGELLGHQDEASSLCLSIDAAIEAIAQQLPPESERPRVFISIGRDPGSLTGVFTASGDSFLDEALGYAGGINIFHDVKNAYPQIARESLLVRRPDVILELQAGHDPNDIERFDALRQDWQDLQTIPAVANDRIIIITESYMLIPGPRVTQTTQRMHRALYGE